MINNAGTWPLDLRLVQFSRYPEDFWTVADACQGVLILGENGSGKTSASGRLFARKYLQLDSGDSCAASRPIPAVDRGAL